MKGSTTSRTSTEKASNIAKCPIYLRI